MVDDVYPHKEGTTAIAIIILGVHIRVAKDFPDTVNSMVLSEPSKKATSMNLVSIVSIISRRPTCVIGARRGVMVIITQPAGPSARSPMDRTISEVFVVNHIE